MKSIHDKLSRRLAVLNRKSVKINTKLNGTEISLIRIDKYSLDSFAGRNYDVFGHSDPRSKLAFDIVGNCLLKYPQQKFDAFSVLDENYQMVTKAFDVNDILPIKLTINFGEDIINEPINIMKGDWLIDIKIDENNNKIPLILEVMKTEMETRGKFLIKRTADLSLVRKNLDSELKQMIKGYIDRFTDVSK
jgi:serine/threonine protein kinase